MPLCFLKQNTLARRVGLFCVLFAFEMDIYLAALGRSCSLQDL